MSDDDKTVFSPGKKKKSSHQLETDDILNGIFRIERFIAQGGMGEVYEAVNIHPPYERVAVKLILPEAASNELVMEMFAKEADTLTRLNHEAIVQYRLAARDEQGRPFIVTAYVDGPSLEDELGSFDFSDEQFGDLAIRLARGLGEAHKLGAIHRDIAPDNVLLVNGDPEKPKIIDFGIAKDAREENAGKTIVGDGFAGKLKYVAPEQLGEYDRNIGPWTDIYSLALTLLAVAMGRHADMGGSIADAVKKRSFVPDISAIPEKYQPAFEAALQPAPADRLQSMKEFINRLKTVPSPKKKSKIPIFTALGAVALSAVAAGGYFVLTGSETDPVKPVDRVVENNSVPKIEEPIVEAGLQVGSAEFERLANNLAWEMPCSWISFDGYQSGAVRFVGGTNDKRVLLQELEKGFEDGNAEIPIIDTENVVTYDNKFCEAIEAFKTVRAPDSLISSQNLTYELSPTETLIRGDTYTIDAYPSFQISDRYPDDELFLVYANRYGVMERIVKNRNNMIIRSEITDGNGSADNVISFSLPFIADENSEGANGFILISGDAPFPESLFGNMELAVAEIHYDREWTELFLREAKLKDWKTDMIWLAMENRVPD